MQEPTQELQENQPQPDLSIIIPTFNEKGRIERSLTSLKNYLEKKEISSEIIIADGGSSDGTVEIAREMLKGHNTQFFTHEERKGKGYSIKEGILNSSGKLVLFTDADFSTPIEDFEILEREIQQGAHIAIGSRALAQSKVTKKAPPHRLFLTKGFNLTKNIIIPHLMHIKDTQCGFKCFEGEKAREIFKNVETEGGMFDVEALLIAKRRGHKIKELPVRWEDDEDSRINLLKCVLFDPVDLLKMRFRDLKGKLK